MNITDVGHMTSDEDTGEDKMEKGASKNQANSNTFLFIFFKYIYYKNTNELLAYYLF